MKPWLRSFRVKNFKAIADSGTVALGKITVFVGYNGSGKSSLVEALETYQQTLLHGHQQALQRWGGFGHACNKHAVADDRVRRRIEFSATFGAKTGATIRHEIAIGTDASGRILDMPVERIALPRNVVVDRSQIAASYRGGEDRSWFFDLPNDHRDTLRQVWDWQFLSMHADAMGHPTPAHQLPTRVRLRRDGLNIAEFLRDIYGLDQNAFDGIVDVMGYVLPYAKALATRVSADGLPQTMLELAEKQFTVPGWMLSTGTVRLLALLALLRHPSPPPLIIIEELENGLDPRCVHLLVDEIRNATEGGQTQVVVTTHSPYLLDLFHVSHLVLVERREDGGARFRRPADSLAVQQWAKTYTPGQLYTMSVLERK
ncbi:MAG: AAA family ATPase [Deltaproteobacteria bacterium]|nr:AAA family ATPase [Deltaproteobacteria bacterium]